MPPPAPPTRQDANVSPQQQEQQRGTAHLHAAYSAVLHQAQAQLAAAGHAAALSWHLAVGAAPLATSAAGAAVAGKRELSRLLAGLGASTPAARCGRALGCWAPRVVQHGRGEGGVTRTEQFPPTHFTSPHPLTPQAHPSSPHLTACWSRPLRAAGPSTRGTSTRDGWCQWWR
jgi:hypothetical protein